MTTEKRFVRLARLADRFGYQLAGLCDNHGRQMDLAVVSEREADAATVPLPADLETDLDQIRALPANADDETVSRAWGKPFDRIETWLLAAVKAKAKDELATLPSSGRAVQ